MNSPNPLLAQLQQARGLVRSGQVQQAIDLLQNLPELNKNEDALLLYGSVCFRAGQLETARKSFETLTRDFPQCVAGWVNLGAALNKLGEHKKAIEIFRRAVQKDRRCADAWYNMGIAQRCLKCTQWRSPHGRKPSKSTRISQMPNCSWLAPTAK